MNISHTLTWSKYLGTDTAAGDMATTGGATYSIVNIQSADDVGLQLSWAGSSPLGTMSFTASNNYDPSTNSGSGAVWTTVPASVWSATGTLNPAGSDSDVIATLAVREVVRAKWLKLTYTPTSGSGTLRCYMHGKG